MDSRPPVGRSSSWSVLTNAIHRPSAEIEFSKPPVRASSPLDLTEARSVEPGATAALASVVLTGLTSSTATDAPITVAEVSVATERRRAGVSGTGQPPGGVVHRSED